MSGKLTTVVENGKKIKKWIPNPECKVSDLVKIMSENPNMKPSDYPEGATVEVCEAARLIVDSREYIDGYVKAGGKYICERLRPGFIGDIVYIPGGASYIQKERGRPFGTIVAIPDGNGEVVIGFSYIDEEDRNSASPSVGLAIALKRAVEGKNAGKVGYSKRWVKNSAAKTQAIHFLKRAKAYFNPEKYSYSRGSEPVVYENYDEIHARRKAILGE